MRADAFGFFWNDAPSERGAKGPTRARAIPPTPDTGWTAPKDLPRLEKAKIIGLDTETKDPDLITKGPGVRRGAHIIGISVSTEDERSWYLPIRHEYGEGNLPIENVMAWAKDNLTRPNQPKVGTNLLYDLDFLAEAGVEVSGPFYDIQIAEALLNEEADGFDLDSLATRHLGETKVSNQLAEWIWQAYGNKNYRAELYRSPVALVGPYAEADASLPIRILRKQLPRLKAEKLIGVWEMESDLIPILLAMRRRGVRINLTKVQKLDDRLVQTIAIDSAKLNSLVGFEVNVDAKEHLVKLFDGLGLTYPRTPPSTRFPEGQPSFVKEFLERHDHPAAQLISGIRRWEKFLGTFIRGYMRNLHVNGRLHCLYNQTRTDEFGTVSGRISSSSPNLQNIPVRDPEWGPLMRAIFEPDKGHRRWARLDWSQIEYRILVHLAYAKLSGDYGSDEAAAKYRDDPATDYHQFVADITKVGREPAKSINFGFVYGMGVDELARQLGMTLGEANPIFEQYHAALPFVKQIRERTSKQAGEQGYITTLLGRRRRFDLWQPRRQQDQDGIVIALPMKDAMTKWGSSLRRAYTHKALNAEIQGSAADLMKKAMVAYWKRTDLVAVLGAPLLTVHDELDYSLPNGKIAIEAIGEVKRLMETVLPLSIPIISELTVARNWGETK